MIKRIKYIYHWFKTLFWIVKYYKAHRDDLFWHVEQAEKLSQEALDVIKHRTEIDVDPSYSGHDASYVFVAGRYKNGDYVQLYSINHPDFIALIDHLKEMSRTGTVKRVDHAPISYSGFIKREPDNI